MSDGKPVHMLGKRTFQMLLCGKAVSIYDRVAESPELVTCPECEAEYRRSLDGRPPRPLRGPGFRLYNTYLRAWWRSASPRATAQRYGEK